MTSKQIVMRANAMVRNVLKDERSKKEEEYNEKAVEDLTTAAYWLLRAIKELK